MTLWFQSPSRHWHKRVDSEVCYPIPPPDDQPIVVTWGVLRRLTDVAQGLT